MQHAHAGPFATPVSSLHSRCGNTGRWRRGAARPTAPCDATICSPCPVIRCMATRRESRYSGLLSIYDLLVHIHAFFDKHSGSSLSLAGVMAPTTPAVAAADPELVLPTLRRFDGEIEEVLATSGHVSLYTMAVETQQWNRKNVEGSLFVLKRRSAPRYQMLVLNKLATENYTEDIHSGLDFELNPPYLMYTHGNHEIIGKQWLGIKN